jgi:hypothetical protein
LGSREYALLIDNRNKVAFIEVKRAGIVWEKMGDLFSDSFLRIALASPVLHAFYDKVCRGLRCVIALNMFLNASALRETGVTHDFFIRSIRDDGLFSKVAHERASYAEPRPSSC